MQWFWDQYTTDPEERAQITASPLRDEGEAYAAELRAVGVPVTSVRHDGTTHDVVGLNPLRHTCAAQAAITRGTAFLAGVLGTDRPAPTDQHRPTSTEFSSSAAWSVSGDVR
uniref:alpha/beta hydrolase fold domain-containing protein n=1 Tax=Kineococcus indalonis TaxID=2696566 RepID=UPI002B1BDFF3|nr:alpha/beta hydrolase fold domain-containing protein [Kineococcus indalonis]